MKIIKLFKKILSDVLMITLLPELFFKFDSLSKQEDFNLSPYAEFILILVEKLDV